MIKNYCLSRTGEMKHLSGTFIIAKAPTIAEALMWSISTISVVFECVF